MLHGVELRLVISGKFFSSVDEWKRLNNNDINNKYESKD